MRLRVSWSDLVRICASADAFYACWVQKVNGKLRPIACPKPPLYGILENLNKILQRLYFPPNLHGGLKGRSTTTYALPHVGVKVLLKFDVQDFFPSVKSGRVYDLFCDELGCSPEVARYLTRLTTHNGAIPQGSPTSTIIAALVSRPLASRVGGLAQAIKGRSGIFVDDGVLSGPHYVGCLEGMIRRIISQERFRAHPTKTGVVPATKEQILTGMRVNHRLDAPRAKVRAVRNLIQGLHARKSRGERISHRDLLSIRGKISWIQSRNPGTGYFLSRQLNKALNASPQQQA